MSFTLGYVSANAVTFDTGAYLEFGKANTGSAQVSAKFKIAEGPDAGKIISWRGSFAGDKSSEITIKTLRAMGFTGHELDKALVMDLSSLVAIKIGEETYQGKTYTKVTHVGKLDGGIVNKNPMTFPEIKALAATLKSKLMESPAPAAPAPSAPAFPGAYKPATVDTAVKEPVAKATDDDNIPW